MNVSSIWIYFAEINQKKYLNSSVLAGFQAQQVIKGCQIDGGKFPQQYLKMN